MCDEFTARADDVTLAKRGLSRRSFAALSAAAIGTVSMSAACAAEEGMAALAENPVEIPTADGKMDAVFFHPAEGKHPAIIMWPDIAGVRDANKIMARALAAQGYAVVLVNQYYRSAKAPVMATISDFFQPGAREKLQPAISAITTAGIESDAKSIVAWLDQQAAVDASKKIGVEGYCMTGSYTVRCAHAVPGRIGAACSFHGGGLVGDAPDSPDKLLKGTEALYLFAVARNDDQQRPGDREALRLAAEAAGVGATVELFQADHGWMVPDAPAYHKMEAERGRTLSLSLYSKMG